MLIHREGLELATNTLEDEGATRFALASIQVGTDGVVLASDGRACLRMAARVDEPTLFDNIAEKTTDDLEAPVLIPADVATAFLASMKKCKAKKGEAKPHVVVATTDGQVTIRSSDGKATRTFLLEAPSSDLKFPDVLRLLKQHRPGTRVVLNVEILSRILRTLRAVKAETVTFDVPSDFDGQMAVAVAAWCDAGPIEGLIMPMRNDGEVHEFGAPVQAPHETAKEYADRRGREIAEDFVASQPEGTNVTLTSNGRSVTVTKEQVDEVKARRNRNARKATR